MELALGVFALVYLGMFLGGLPGLALDRTGVAVLGAIAMVALARLEPAEAWASVDPGTLGLLAGLMVVSAQLRLGGFYAAVTRRVAEAPVGPRALLALVTGLAGLLSALLANDIVCLAMTPLLVEGCGRRGYAPLPFLLALAAAANVGSAATLIGNPQNMLIGQALSLSFAGYLLDALVPALLGLGAVWAVIARAYRGRFEAPTRAVAPGAVPALDRWQSAKGLALLLALVGAFLVGAWPRDVLALGAAGLLLTSRRMSSRTMLGLVDWHLLALFIGLFVVQGGLEKSGALGVLFEGVAALGLDLGEPVPLFAAAAVLSNLVSNVPATMLLLPVTTHPQGGAILALSSTLAGNLLLVGSIANLIVAEQAGRLGVTLGWREHARVGVPITLLTLLLAALWLALRGA